MSFGRRVLISLLGVAASMGIVAAPAMATGGEVGAFSSHGTGPGQLSEPLTLGVDSADNSFFVIDIITAAPAHYELKKFSSSTGQEVGSAEIPRVVGGLTQRLTAPVVDPAKERVYLLASRTAESNAEEIYVFDTTPNGSGELVPPASLGGASTLPIPAGAKPLNSPFGIAVDPSSHDIVIGAHTGTSEAEEEETVVQKITETGDAGARFTKDGSFFMSGTNKPDGLAVSEDGTTFLSSGSQNGRLQVFKLPASLASVEEITSMSSARGTEQWVLEDGLAPPPKFNANAATRGPQIAISPDGKTLYFPQLYSLEPGSGGIASVLVRAFSLQEGKTTALYGDGATTCVIQTKEPDIAVGNSGNVFVLEHMNGNKSLGGRVVEFGPTGSACPTPTASLSVDGSEDASSTVEKAQTVSLQAYGAPEALKSELHGAYPTAVTWNVTGPEAFTVHATSPAAGEPISLETEHKFLKGGTYTIKLEVETAYLAGGNPASTSKTLVVEGVAPTAFFVPSPVSPVAGEPVTFDASGSSDPILGPLTGAKYLWSFGDGTSAETSGPTTSHTYASASEPTVTLVVKNEEGLSSQPFSESLVVRPAASTGGGGGGSTSGGGSPRPTPTPTPTPVPTPVPTPKPIPKPKPKPSPLKAALAKCTKKKGKAKTACVKAAQKKFGKKKAIKKH
jgi:PKD repeat protein